MVDKVLKIKNQLTSMGVFKKQKIKSNGGEPC
jgi:hypothetical protein